nr:2656_t:CDS:2 [Entrophospora candida]
MASRYPEYGQSFVGVNVKRTPIRHNNNNNVNYIKRNSQPTGKKNAGVNSLPIRENANIANVVSSLSTEEEESTLETFVEITDLEKDQNSKLIVEITELKREKAERLAKEAGLVTRIIELAEKAKLRDTGLNTRIMDQ